MAGYMDNGQLVCECGSKDADRQYSFGLYAGIYCDPCWKISGYRDANEEVDRAELDEEYYGDSWDE